jgi:hypothetical protein
MGETPHQLRHLTQRGGELLLLLLRRPVDPVLSDADRVSRLAGFAVVVCPKYAGGNPVNDAINCACSSMIFVKTDGSNAWNCPNCGTLPSSSRSMARNLFIAMSHADFALPCSSWKSDSAAPRMYLCGTE